MTLSVAVQTLQSEVDGFLQGTKSQPKEGSTEWFLLRAKSLGLSYLKAAEGSGVEQPARAREAEAIYKARLAAIKGDLE